MPVTHMPMRGEQIRVEERRIDEAYLRLAGRKLVVLNQQQAHQLVDDPNEVMRPHWRPERMKKPRQAKKY